MRRLEITVPLEHEVKVLQILKGLEITYYSVSSLSNTTFVVVLPKTYVDSLVTELKKIGIGRAIGSIIVSNVTFFLSAETVPKEASMEASKLRKGRLDRVALDEIVASAKENGKISMNYIMLTIFAAVLASLGLLGDNVVVIIGSMIVAPLMGPIVATSLSTVISERGMFREAMKAEVLGIFICVGAGFVLAILFPEPFLTSEILGRSRPHTADVGLAIVSGLAAGVCFVYGYATTLVGVAIAASLAPPAANLGVLIGMSELSYARGSLELLLINILAINITCTLVFWIAHVKPTTKRREIAARRLLKKRVIIAAIALIATSATIIYPAVNAYTNASIEHRAIKIVEDEINKLNNPDEKAKLLEVRADYDPASKKLSVTVYIIVNETLNNEFRNNLANRISSETGAKTELTLWVIMAQTENYVNP